MSKSCVRAGASGDDPSHSAIPVSFEIPGGDESNDVDPGYGRGAIPLTLEEVLSKVIDDESEVERVASEIRAVASAKAALQVSA